MQQDHEIQRSIHQLNEKNENERNNFAIECDYEIEITKFSNTLTKSLEDNLRKKLAPRRSHINKREAFVEA